MARQEPFRVLAQTIPYDKLFPLEFSRRRRLRRLDPVPPEPISKGHRGLPGRVGRDGEARSRADGAFQRTL